jgi:catechol 2,3-dioxygenase
VGRELMMGTDPVDVPALVRAAGDAPWAGMPAGTVVGHVHLHVGDLDAARRFYGDGLGFDRTVWSYPGALFFGAGGYHHHLGTNTWAGPGAGPPAEGDARLVEWTVELPNAADVDAAAASLAAVGQAAGRADGGGDDGGGGGGGGSRDVVARDPWGTAVRLRAAPRADA